MNYCKKYILCLLSLQAHGDVSCYSPIRPASSTERGGKQYSIRPTGTKTNGSAELPMLHPRTMLPMDTNSPKSFVLTTRTNASLFRTKGGSTSMGQVLLAGAKKNTWLSRLQNISNVASLLCVLDCTILPVVTLLFPLMGLAASPDRMAWIHELGHSVAMYFVLPVGGSTALLNLYSHKKPRLLLPAMLGLALVYLANAHGGPILSLLPHELAHKLHCGTVLHRLLNISGCAMILLSNFVSRRHTHSDNCCTC